MKMVMIVRRLYGAFRSTHPRFKTEFPKLRGQRSPWMPGEKHPLSRNHACARGNTRSGANRENTVCATVIAVVPTARMPFARRKAWKARKTNPLSTTIDYESRRLIINDLYPTPPTPPILPVNRGDVLRTPCIASRHVASRIHSARCAHVVERKKMQKWAAAGETGIAFLGKPINARTDRAGRRKRRSTVVVVVAHASRMETSPEPFGENDGD